MGEAQGGGLTSVTVVAVKLARGLHRPHFDCRRSPHRSAAASETWLCLARHAARAAATADAPEDTRAQQVQVTPRALRLQCFSRRAIIRHRLQWDPVIVECLVSRRQAGGFIGPVEGLSPLFLWPVLVVHAVGAKLPPERLKLPSHVPHPLGCSRNLQRFWEPQPQRPFAASQALGAPLTWFGDARIALDRAAAAPCPAPVAHWEIGLTSAANYDRFLALHATDDWRDIATCCRPLSWVMVEVGKLPLVERIPQADFPAAQVDSARACTVFWRSFEEPFPCRETHRLVDGGFHVGGSPVVRVFIEPCRHTSPRVGRPPASTSPSTSELEEMAEPCETDSSTELCCIFARFVLLGSRPVLGHVTRLLVTISVGTSTCPLNRTFLSISMPISEGAHTVAAVTVSMTSIVSMFSVCHSILLNVVFIMSTVVLLI